MIREETAGEVFGKVGCGESHSYLNERLKNLGFFWWLLRDTKKV